MGGFIVTYWGSLWHGFFCTPFTGNGCNYLNIILAAQDALNREKANADALRRRLSELEGQVPKGSSLEPLLADTKARLKAAEAEAEKLRNVLEQLKQQMKVNYYSSTQSSSFSYDARVLGTGLGTPLPITHALSFNRCCVPLKGRERMPFLVPLRLYIDMLNCRMNEEGVYTLEMGTQSFLRGVYTPCTPLYLHLLLL
jgi:hypothetical protein